MSTRDELEASLRARPDDATLAVYADLLQAQGDPRGELIALDLTPPHMSTNGLEVRRGQLLEKWLGDDVDLVFDREQQIWYAGDLSSSFATFHCGFISLAVTELGDTWDLPLARQRVAAMDVVAKLLDTAAGTYLRDLSLSGPTAMLEPLLDSLGARPRPWLQRLAIKRPSHETPLLVWGTSFARATPNLELLDLEGSNLLGQFTHPALRTLAVTGSEAIDLVKGPPLPALHTIDYAFVLERDVPRGVFHPDRLPALRRLDFSREEPGALALFDVIGTLAVAPQLTHLVLPAIRSDDDRALVQAAIDRMPVLREITIARAYACHGQLSELRHTWARMKQPTPLPWPPRETLIDQRLRINGFVLDLADLVGALEEHLHDMTPDDHAIWIRFWSMLDEDFVEHAFNTADLVRALAPLSDSNLQALRAHLQSRIAQRAQGHLVSILWD